MSKTTNKSYIRLSEAIRLGSMLGPQIFGKSLGPNDSSCAYGAAKLAVGAATQVEVKVLWPWLATLKKCPECGKGAGAGVISVHLNDKHKWTRERIADWVETVEPKLVEDKSDQDEVACSVELIAA